MERKDEATTKIGPKNARQRQALPIAPKNPNDHAKEGETMEGKTLPGGRVAHKKVVSWQRFYNRKKGRLRLFSQKEALNVTRGI